MNSSNSTEALVALENDGPDVLFEKALTVDMHLWPLIRLPLARWSVNEELGTSDARPAPTPHTTGSIRRAMIKRYSDAFIANPYSSSRAGKQADVMFIVKGGTSALTSRGLENWLVHDFAQSLGHEAVILQSLPIPRSPEGTPAFARTYSYQDAMLRASLRSRRNRLSEDEVTHTKRVVSEIIRNYPMDVSDEVAAKVVRLALSSLREIPGHRTEFAGLLRRADPKVVIMDSASYVNRPGITKAIRDHGVMIVEPQHGWIGKPHAAYNFGAAMSSPTLTEYLPEVLLTFGDFWSTDIRHPGRIVSIGKPYLERKALEHSAAVAKRILLVSSVYRTDELMRTAVELRDRLPEDWTVSLRPHPSERPRAREQFSGALSETRIELDLEPDVYASFGRAAAVYGYASTVLFEALAFDVPVFVFESGLADLYAPTHVFGKRITSPADLGSSVEFVLSGRRDVNEQAMVDHIWKPGAVANFSNFMDSLARV